MSRAIGKVGFDHDPTEGVANVVIDGPVATNRCLVYETANLDRWAICADSDAESGANAGSNLIIRRFDDAGVLIGTVMDITRSNGLVTLTNALTVEGLITANGGVTLGAGDDLVGSATSDIDMNSNFTVAGATGNTVVAGTLIVTGTITSGDLTVSSLMATDGSGVFISDTSAVTPTFTDLTLSNNLDFTASDSIIEFAFGTNFEESFGLVLTLQDSGGTNRFSVENSVGDRIIHADSDGTVGFGAAFAGSTVSVFGNSTIGAGFGTGVGPTNGLAVEGNLGVGILAPLVPIHIEGDGDLIRLESTTQATPIWSFEAHGTGGSVFSMESNSAANGDVRLRNLIAAGNLNLDTNSVTRLSVHGTGGASATNVHVLNGDLVAEDGLAVGKNTGPTTEIMEVTGNIEVTGQAFAKEFTLTDATTIAVDMNDSNTFVVTLGGNRTLGAPSNLKAGSTIIIRIVQDGTPPRTLAYNAVWKFPGGTAPVLSTGANEVDILTGVTDGTNVNVVLEKDFS